MADSAHNFNIAGFITCCASLSVDGAPNSDSQEPFFRQLFVFGGAIKRHRREPRDCSREKHRGVDSLIFDFHTIL